jgi:hypothetical protein
VREHDVLDRLVRHLADAADHVGRHRGRGLRVGDQHRVVADDDAGVGVAFGRIGPGMLGQLREADFFLFQVGLGGEGFAHDQVGRTSSIMFNSRVDLSQPVS